MNQLLSAPLKTSLYDLYFLSQYVVYTNRFSGTVSKALQQYFLSICKEAVEKDIPPSECVSAFLAEHGSAITKSTVVKGLTLEKRIQNDLALMDTFKVFMKYLTNEEAKDHGSWCIKRLPSYFLDHPLHGVATKLVSSADDLDGLPNENQLVFIEDELERNCCVGGYIKSPIKAMFMSRHFDKKPSNELLSFLNRFGIPTKLTKEKLSGAYQHYSLTITPNEVDKEYLDISAKFRLTLETEIRKIGTGKKYFLALDNDPVKQKGFKSISDVDKFLRDLAKQKMISGTRSDGTHIYLTQTLECLSIQTVSGETIPLGKFGIDQILKEASIH